MMRRVGLSPDHARPTFIDSDRPKNDARITDIDSIAERISSQQAGASAADLFALGDAADDMVARTRTAQGHTQGHTISDRAISHGTSDDGTNTTGDADSDTDGDGAAGVDAGPDATGQKIAGNGSHGATSRDTMGHGKQNAADPGIPGVAAEQAAEDATGDGPDAGTNPNGLAPADEPSPADMPKRREHTVSTLSFAALSSHELPVVREYSAGGLIFNESGEVAIIARHSRSGHLEWCLPKGHIEKGETPEQTAVREVHEETGIKGEVTGSIATIDYWFTGENQRVHKLVHHFVLRQVSGHLTVEGDPDHEAEDAAWVPFHELPAVLSYPNERRIVHLYSRKYRRRS